MVEKYTLMNQNKEVLKFEYNKDLNVITKINEINHLEFAPLNIKNIEQLKILEKVYKEMLVKYQEYTKLSQNEINMLVEGYRKRIEIFEKLNKRT